MTLHNENKLLQLAFLTALAASIHIIESLIMRMMPLPFLRIGLSNVVVLYLIYKNRSWEAIAVNFSKSILGGIATFTLLTPATLLSLAGGLGAILIMLLFRWLNLGLSIYGISICGAISHNLIQLTLVYLLLIKSSSVFVLTPLLLSIALLSGSLIAYVTLYVDTKFKLSVLWEK